MTFSSAAFSLPPCTSRWTPSCSQASNIADDAPPICVRNVSYWRPGGRQILNNISLSVKPGELAMLVGRNGCGKSTFLKVIRGLIKPTLGKVGLSTPTAFVDQHPERQIVMPTVGGDVALFLRLPADYDDDLMVERVHECLISVGLEPPERFAKMGSFRLSGGERQRVAVASALASKPKVLLMDEVTASMDAENRLELLSRMRALVSKSRVAVLWYVYFILFLSIE